MIQKNPICTLGYLYHFITNKYIYTCMYIYICMITSNKVFFFWIPIGLNMCTHIYKCMCLIKKNQNVNMCIHMHAYYSNQQHIYIKIPTAQE